jgi:NhaP-type Na+/H+ or K+/H+ antiporter
MEFTGWLAFAGILLLTMALSSAYVRRLPISTSIIYLVAGVVVGPAVLNWLRIDFVESAEWLEKLTEVAVIISLFIGGLKLRLPLRDPAWRAAFVLAAPVMLVCIAGVAAYAHVVLGMDLATALLLGAVLAPTDPVLASAISVNDANDRDRMRYGLSGEAGLNDGMAFPFVIFALALAANTNVAEWVGGWALHRLVWAVPAGLLIGYLMGRGIGLFAIRLRNQQQDTDAPSDFLALALIALSYVLAETVGAWGFLAAFAAGVGLRHAEVKVVAEAPHPEQQGSPSALEHAPAEELVDRTVDEEALKEPAVAAGVVVAETLSFGDTVERLMEVLLVLLVGISLTTHWDARAIPLALVLFVVIRPLASRLLLTFTPTRNAQRWLMGWFGIRGIGSLYYLAYAINHDATDRAAVNDVSLTLSVIAISIVLHGISSTPLLKRYEQMLSRDKHQGQQEKPARRQEDVNRKEPKVLEET